MKVEAVPAVELIKVSKSFDAVQAVRELSLVIRQGELLTLLGPSGCGKTTLLRMIAGFETPSAGSIVIDGRDVDGGAALSARHRHGVPELRAVPAHERLDNVAFGLRMRNDGEGGDRARGRAARSKWSGSAGCACTTHPANSRAASSSAWRSRAPS